MYTPVEAFLTPIFLQRIAVLLLFVASSFALYDIFHLFGIFGTKKKGIKKRRSRKNNRNGFSVLMILQKVFEKNSDPSYGKEKLHSWAWYRKYIYNPDHIADFRYDAEKEGWLVTYEEDPAFLQMFFTKHSYNRVFSSSQKSQYFATRKTGNDMMILSLGERGTLAVPRRKYHPHKPLQQDSLERERVWQRNASRSFDEGEILDVSKSRFSCSKSLQEEANEIVSALFMREDRT